MATNRTLFSQLMDFLPQKSFDRIIKKYRGHYKVKSFSCRDQFYAMGFRRGALSQYIGQCQSNKGLAHLCGAGSGLD